jgi:anti-sigma regulatory factor (Ser/Thr protein kinase)
MWRRCAVELGFDEVLSAQAAIVVNELGTNLVKHAKAVACWWPPAAAKAVPELEILSIDHGPGIGDLAMAMRDGFSTAGSPGTGLGAVKRLAADFGIHSDPARARSRWRGCAAAAWATLAIPLRRGGDLPAPGEVVCGDGWAGLPRRAPKPPCCWPTAWATGEHAEEASQAAVSLFVQQPFALSQGGPGIGACLVAHDAWRGRDARRAGWAPTVQWWVRATC